MSSGVARLWDDLRRRRVFQVAAIYAAVAWVIVQVADVVGPAVNMPGWVMTAIVGFAMVGFPIAVVLAWIFDIGPGGVVRTKPGSATGVLAIVAALGLLATGTAGFVWSIKPGEQTDSFAFDFDPIANSVAVMPFTDLSPDSSFEHFTDGIAEVLIHRLLPIAQLTVLASNSSFAFKDEHADVRTIGRKLRAERLLMGSVQRSGNRLRISTRLVDAKTGESVWTKQFDREGKDIFDIQDEIALAVVDEMDVQVEQKIRDRVTKPMTNDLDAWDLYLLAVHEIRNTPLDNGNAKGIELLEQAVEKDPELALAWAALAKTVYWHGNRGYISVDEGIRRSRDYLARALELDPELSEAYTHAMIITTISDGDFDTVRRSFEKAVEYGPSNWSAYVTFGMLLNNSGQHNEAVTVLSRGLELNPYKPESWLRFNLGDAYIRLGKYEEGMRLLAANYSENQGSSHDGQHLRQLANGAFVAGRLDEAIATYEIAAQNGHGSALTYALLAISLLGVGDVSAATIEVNRAELIMAEQRAQGRTMNFGFILSEAARFQLDIATNDIENQLLAAKRLVTFVDEEEGRWSDVRTYDAVLASLLVGRFDDAARLIDPYTKTTRDPENFAFAAYAYRQLGNKEKTDFFLTEGRIVLEEFTRDWDPSAGFLELVALFLAVDGQVNEAIEALQAAYEFGFRNHAHLVYMPLFDPIRNDQRFIELVRKMRADTALMRERVDKVRATGDWNSLIARHFDD